MIEFQEYSKVKIQHYSYKNHNLFLKVNTMMMEYALKTNEQAQVKGFVLIQVKLQLMRLMICKTSSWTCFIYLFVL